MFVPAARPKEEFAAVKELLRLGLSDYEVARRAGIPRATVRNWRLRSSAPSKGRVNPLLLVPYEEWRPPDAIAYCYLLGLYLGAGASWTCGTGLLGSF